MEDESEFLAHVPCPSCGSSDANSLYSDGHTYCFSCGAYGQSDGEVTIPSGGARKRMKDFLDGEIKALPKRKLTEETCKKFNYRVGDYKDRPCQIANYYNPEGTEIVAQKIRFPNKDFTVVGNMKEAGLFGQNLWRDKGRMITITEGEIDALSISQLQDNKWPVVSIPNGAQGAKKALAKHLDWLLGFDTVVLFFDNDAEGQKAVDECAPLFPIGRVKVARMSEYKDASEALQAGDGGKVIDAVWSAKSYRPDGIVAGVDSWDSLTSDEEIFDTAAYPWEGVQKMTHGLRRGELVTFTAGSGVGKSAFVREIAHSLILQDETVGMIMLEESVKRTLKGLLGIELSKPIHLDTRPYSELTDEEKQERKTAHDVLFGSGKVFLYDHFGSTEVDNLLARIRYMIVACGCTYVILDHLSIVVSGLDDGDERKAIDVAMTKLRTLVQETGVGLIMVSHLRRPSGDKGHEQGAETSLSQLRGSHSIAQLSDMVIGIERNQQDEKTANVSTVRVLKNRFSGETGIASHIHYNQETGRLAEINPDYMRAFADESNEDEDPF